ncbi:MAG TPA: biofilm-associated protein, partial [Nitrosopumilus sp.]|nr:biofilm-associated protein [Nitrosopumilus sp.]
IKGVPDVVNRGDFLEIFGTGDPGSAITAEIKTSEGNVINSRTAEVDAKGNWKLEEPVIVALDTPFGKYSATITDGRENKLIYWEVKSDKKIIITPVNLKFEPGETMRFNGTALPNQQIEIVLEDPLGNEVLSDIIQTDEVGFVEFEFETTQATSEGTYTLIATQEKEKEFIYAGLGQLPTIPVNLEFDKLSYKIGETAIITLSGKASEIINLLIIDPSDKPKGDAISITLQPDGRGTHSIELDGYASGVYTAVISKGSAQSTEVFTVGLQTGSGEIDINTTKLDYHPGDSVLILGETGPNVLLTVSLINPEGEEIKVKETFSDKNGKISEGSFRIPSDGIPGTWIINAKSGSNFDNEEINVTAVVQEGMIVSVEEGQEIPGYGKTVNIHVFGASQTVEIEIIAEDGEVIQELSFPASGDGEINQPWIIPKDTEPGTYTIKVSDAYNNAETTFEIQ